MTVPQHLVAAVHRRRLVHLGVAAFACGAAGFAVTGLARLVLDADTAVALGAPLLVIGFVLAATTAVLAAMAWTGILTLEEAG